MKLDFENDMKKLWGRWRWDYRHFLCFLITLASIGFGFLFPNSLPRLAETVRDLVWSVAYYFCELVSPNANPIRPTVILEQSWQFAPEPWEPLKLLPYTWEEFKALWGQYWDVIFTKANFLAYWEAIGDLMFYLSRLSLIFLPLIMVAILLLQRYKNKHITTRGKKSVPLQRYERFKLRVVYPAVAWCKSFVEFVKENDGYWKAWALLWALHFNLFSMAIALAAYYLFFAASWSTATIYPQLLKLMRDLAPIVRFIPGLIWLGFGIWLYNYICRSMAFNRLYYYEDANRAFLAQRGIVTTIYGEMGIGKTQLVTSMALSAEVEQFDMAFEILLETEMHFPNFPYQPFRDALKNEIQLGNVVDLPSCRKWVQHCGGRFARITSITSAARWRSYYPRYNFALDYTFGYDYDLYPVTYNDELKITPLFEALEDYACAFLVFTIKTTLLFSNYSIRLDSMVEDIGNMPLRDNDFFHRDPAYQEAYSHHAHIIDFDMLRLGKKMVKDNPKARRVSFGVYVVTEIDKERKNALQLKETKINTDETNQKNDLMDACLMMIRHACVISNRVFVRVICDLQRPEAWGAGGRELGEVIYIKEKSELAPALPFFSPYWLCQGCFAWIRKKWLNFYTEYIHRRSDRTLFMDLAHGSVSAINNHYDKLEGLFGVQTLTLELQSGRMDGEVKEDKWRILTKKDRSRRYRTACLEAVFESYEPNTMHIDDFAAYAAEVGSQAENGQQNSFFQTDIAKMKGTL